MLTSLPDSGQTAQSQSDVENHLSKDIPHPNGVYVAKTLHYRLTAAEWITLCNTLKPAELKVLIYLRTLNPFHDRELEIGVRDLAAQLGLSPSAVSRALKHLQAQGYIDLELIAVRLKVKSKGVPTPKPAPTPKSSEQSTLPPDPPRCVDTIPVASRQQPLLPDNSQPPEPKLKASSEPSHTLNTDQPDLKEREKPEISTSFRNWLINKANQLPLKPAILEQWLEKQATRPSVIRDYLKSTTELPQRTHVPAAAPFPQSVSSYPLAHLSEAEQQANHLARLQAKWKQPHLRAAAIAEAQTLGFQVTEAGIVEAAAPCP
jgi:DNA-binding Lrp family transcriptional regulator